MLRNFFKKLMQNHDFKKENEQQKEVIKLLKDKIEDHRLEETKNNNKSKELNSIKKGKEGETLIQQSIHELLDQKEFYSLHDLTLSIDGMTTQIDHVVVGKKGIFVIETKNIRGWIFGDKYSKKWTVSLNKNKRYSIQNPLHQNYRHTETIKELLPRTKPENIVSVVVFVSKCEFKKELPENVIKLDKLISFIENSDKEISKDEMYYTIGALEHLKEKQDNIDTIHVNNLKKKHKNKEIA